MACTKVFSGNLPEIMSKILQYFQNDYSTLHSCILVNRLWCRLAIPLLWEDPFSLIYPKNYRYIEVYLNNLNENERTQLNKYGIINGLFPLNTLFNYTIFIHRLDTHIIRKSIKKWVATVDTSIIEKQLDYPRQKNNDLNYTKLIYKLLLQILIENKENIHTFKTVVISDEDFEYFDDTIEIILQNPSFIRNIRNLILDFDISNENTIKFMKFLSSKCNYISLLHFSFPLFCNTAIEKHLSQIIDSQQNLKKILFDFNDNLPLYHSLLSLKNPNCTNTLRTIIFYHINFKNIVILNEVFEKLNVLESIHIYYCYFLDSNFIQQIINLTKPFHLKSLFVDELTCSGSLEPLQLLLQKSGNYLENFGLGSLEQEVLDLIIKYCTKIKFLEFRGRFENQAIYKILQLIEKVKISLNYLTIDIYKIDKIQFDSILLQNLGQILPSKLEYLNLELTININDFEIFLKNSQNTFIKKLLIRNIRNRGQQLRGQEIEKFLPYIKEYIMKKKRTKYLAFQGYVYTYTSEVELVHLKDEVKEFKLYNIMVQNYDYLIIDSFDFINEMY
ncbi:hypothetical protein RclHR1_00690024 [Rhizophagus clarus]|uniref:F-box domain-containing protein n=1 Tax=Rhizophagus clarus TaxID=94130 RepID=A0A2Z6RUX2_9GLOM|nr:hypothetical protein RclHR1_00690024 [Rhizophagus clarus]GES83704.1 hypothetical protein GLOIN_2v1867536 [Rhizophagus clarus]